MKRLWKNIALAAASALLVMALVGCALESEAATHEPETKADEGPPASLGVVTAANAATGAPPSQSAALFDKVAAVKQASG